MNRIKDVELRNKIKNDLNYSSEDRAIMKTVYDTFKTAEGLSFQINSVLKNHGKICYVLVKNNKWYIETVVVDLI